MKANDEAIRYLEDSVVVRSGQDGVHVAKCRGLMVAKFLHAENRGGEAHIHIHNAIMSMAATTNASGEGIYANLDEHELFNHYHAAGAVADCVMARELSALGLEIGESKSYGFRVTAVPEAYEKANAERTNEISEYAEKKGVSRGLAQADTKGVKQHRSLEAMERAWTKKGNEFGWGAAEAAAAFSGSPRSQAPEDSLVLGAMAKVAFARLTVAIAPNLSQVRTDAQHGGDGVEKVNPLLKAGQGLEQGDFVVELCCEEGDGHFFLR